MAAILRSRAGEEAAFRYGGDEFCLVFHAPELRRIVQACEQIGRSLEEMEDFSPCRWAPASGVAEYRPSMTPAQLLKNADSALYRAKEKRGSVCLWKEQTE